jgi:putative membrane protein
MWHYGFGWGFPFFPLMWLGFWLLLMVFFFRGRRGWHHRMDWHTQGSAEELLRTRFAQGEIDEKEYKEKMAVLSSK